MSIRPRAGRLWLPALLACLALAACGGDDEPAAGAGKTRTVTDATGTRVEVPAEPRRVVAAGETELDAALALGVKPVATIAGRGQPGEAARYLGDRAEGMPTVGEVTGPVPERVLEHDPDLILLQFVTDRATLDQLRKIAPVVVTGREAGDWKADFKRVAAALGREDRAQEWLADYDKRAADARGALGGEASSEISIVRWSAKQPAFIPASVFASRVLTEDLGLRRPKAQAGKLPAHSAPISLENLDRLDGDWMFIGTLAATGPDVASLEDARRSPAFRALDVAQADHVVPVDGSYWGSRGGPLAARAVIDDVEQALTAGAA